MGGRWLWLLLLLLPLGAIAVELAVRALDARRGYPPPARAAWYWMFEQDPLLGYRGRPFGTVSIDPPGLPLNADRIRHDAEGFRDRRSLADLGAPKGRRLVLCVGDADTYGLTAGSEERTYPAVLERELRRLSGDPRWVVFNAGLPGYTSHEALQLLKLRLLKLQPEAVVFMGLRYEHEQVSVFLDEQLDYDDFALRLAPLPRSRGLDLVMRSVVAGRLVEKWRNRSGQWPRAGRPRRHYGEATLRGTRLYLDNVALMAELCRRSNVRLMVADQPIHFSTCSYGPTMIASVDRMRAALRGLAASLQVPLLQAHEGFDWDGVEVRGDMLFATNEAVLGPLGFERLALRLAPQVLAAAAPGPGR